MAAPSRYELRKWKSRTETIKRSAEILMSQMLDYDETSDLEMTLSDWADNLICDSGDLIDLIERRLTPPQSTETE